ncbi:collagen alpha-1(I) chain-like [Talpa occidentalis]|uniref:collagen alpha-1(I) chain-like n=1 Tax=Talpa occidentalis TaxID=50954 RepID=UPI0018909EAB|nr:collagen alpha-1(I) chain-like [Talpa occidentalis]
MAGPGAGREEMEVWAGKASGALSREGSRPCEGRGGSPRRPGGRERSFEVKDAQKRTCGGVCITASRSPGRLPCWRKEPTGGRLLLLEPPWGRQRARWAQAPPSTPASSPGSTGAGLDEQRRATALARTEGAQAPQGGPGEKAQAALASATSGLLENVCLEYAAPDGHDVDAEPAGCETQVPAALPAPESSTAWHLRAYQQEAGPGSLAPMVAPAFTSWEAALATGLSSRTVSRSRAEGLGKGTHRKAERTESSSPRGNGGEAGGRRAGPPRLDATCAWATARRKAAEPFTPNRFPWSHPGTGQEAPAGGRSFPLGECPPGTARGLSRLPAPRAASVGGQSRVHEPSLPGRQPRPRRSRLDGGMEGHAQRVDGVPPESSQRLCVRGLLCGCEPGRRPASPPEGQACLRGRRADAVVEALSPARPPRRHDSSIRGRPVGPPGTAPKMTRPLPPSKVPSGSPFGGRCRAAQRDHHQQPRPAPSARLPSERRPDPGLAAPPSTLRPWWPQPGPWGQTPVHGAGAGQGNAGQEISQVDRAQPVRNPRASESSEEGAGPSALRSPGTPHCLEGPPQLQTAVLPGPCADPQAGLSGVVGSGGWRGDAWPRAGPGSCTDPGVQRPEGVFRRGAGCTLKAPTPPKQPRAPKPHPGGAGVGASEPPQLCSAEPYFFPGSCLPGLPSPAGDAAARGPPPPRCESVVRRAHGAYFPKPPQAPVLRATAGSSVAALATEGDLRARGGSPRQLLRSGVLSPGGPLPARPPARPPAWLLLPGPGPRGRWDARGTARASSRVDLRPLRRGPGPLTPTSQASA